MPSLHGGRHARMDPSDDAIRHFSADHRAARRFWSRTYLGSRVKAGLVSEIEINVLSLQCLDRRIPARETMVSGVAV